MRSAWSQRSVLIRSQIEMYNGGSDTLTYNQFEDSKIRFFYNMDIMDELQFGSTIAQYTVTSIKGKGRFGIVYQCQDKKTKERVAIKQSQLYLQAEGISSIALREISMLNQLKHPNIVNLKNVIIEKQSLFLVFQLLDYDLSHYLELSQNMSLTLKQVKNIVFQIVKAVQFCHSHRVIHRDIKPGNIFVGREGSIKLGDFGLSRTITYPIKPLSEEVVTLWYRAPQILLGSPFYGPPIDIWSVGCIFGELILGMPLFQGSNEMDQINRIFEKMGRPTKESWPECAEMRYFNQMTNEWTDSWFQKLLSNSNLDSGGKDLLKKMLTLNPKQRIEANEALKHPFFMDEQNKMKQ